MSREQCVLLGDGRRLATYSVGGREVKQARNELNPPQRVKVRLRFVEQEKDIRIRKHAERAEQLGELMLTVGQRYVINDLITTSRTEVHTLKAKNFVFV